MRTFAIEFATRSRLNNYSALICVWTHYSVTSAYKSVRWE